MPLASHILLLSGLCLIAGVGSARDLTDASIEPRAFAWPEPGRVPKARVNATFTGDDVQVGKTALRVSYEFPDDRCTQVVLDLPLRLDDCYRKLQLRVRGDGSGNELVLWLRAAGRWFGLGRIPLDFTNWKRAVFDVRETDTDVATMLRFCIVRKGGPGRHVVILDGLDFEKPGPPRVQRFFVFGKNIPEAVRRLPGVVRKFKKALVKNDDRTLLLLDGEPLFCVLDVRFDADYLQAARRCGVNAFALDLYWRNIEPRRGYREWPALREKLAELQRLGFGVILMIGPHQPPWWGRQHNDLPGALEGKAYPLSPPVVHDFGGLLRDLVLQTRDFRNVIGYVVSAGGEQDSSFAEVPGEPGAGSVWRNDPTCLKHYRDWLRRRYGTIDALRAAWRQEDVSFERAGPPERLPGDDYRRAWLDWAEFTNGWWVRYAAWAASIVRPLAPEKLLIARFGWPVFQAENVFLARSAEADLVQCKDAVAAWEVGHPGRQLWRTALYYGALRHSAKVVFPEMDIIHGRGYQEGDLSRYVPLFARFAGALWYYRGIMDRNQPFLQDLSAAVSAGTRLVRESLGEARVGIFYSLAFANWISLHRNYENEAALTGAAELFHDLNLRFAAVSEFTLSDLFDLNLVAIPYNPAIARKAERVLRAWLAVGGAVVMEADAGTFDLTGRRRSRGTLDFAPVRIAGRTDASPPIEFSFSATGFPPFLRLDTGLRERVRPVPGGTIPGACRDSYVVSKNRVLYIPCRFFAPYSYGKKTDRAAARDVLSAFLRIVAPGQERMARDVLTAVRSITGPPPARFLKQQAERAFRKGLYVRSIWLGRLAAVLADKPRRQNTQPLPAGILLREMIPTVQAAAVRVQRLRRIAGPGRTAGERTRPPLVAPDDALRPARRALEGGADPLQALALLTIAREELAEQERRLMSSF